MLVRRRFLAERYGRLLQELQVTVPRAPAWAHTNWQTFWIELADRMDRDQVMQRMRDAGVATRRGISCAHREPVYTSEPWRAGPRGLPNSERAQDRGLMLPLYHEMTESDQDFVVEVLAAALSAGAVRADR
jgi:dTDP-4-amino-4,6-dideoxygalactose transaminase